MTSSLSHTHFAGDPAFFREFVEGTDDLITQVDISGQFTYVNRAAQHILGMSPEECIGMLAFDIIHPDDRAGTQAAFRGWIAQRVSSATFENRLVSRTGDIHHMLWTINLHYDKHGVAIMINSIARDITERKQAQAVEHERDFIVTVMDTVSSFVVVYDATGHIIRFNRACEQATGYTFDEMQGKLAWELLVPPDDVSTVQSLFTRRTDFTTVEQLECTWVTQAGEQRLITWSYTALLNDAGAPEYYIATGTDITEQRRTEEALRQSEERFREFVEGTDALVTQVDANGCFTYVNNTAERILGLPSEQCLGLSAFDFIHPDDKAITQRNFGKWLEAQAQSAEFENRQVSRTGDIHYMLWTINLHFDDAGHIKTINSIARDITDRKRAEEIIEAQAATLAEVSTPLIPLADGVVVMPLIGNMDTARAQKVMETLLIGVGEQQAAIAILDITGLPLVDTHVANALVRTAQAVKLLGAQMVITGIRPEVAQTLIGMGADLTGIVTHSNLQSGIRYALGGDIHR